MKKQPVLELLRRKRARQKKVMAKKDSKLKEIKTLLTEEIEPKFEKFRNDKRVYIEFKTQKLLWRSTGVL